MVGRLEVISATSGIHQPLSTPENKMLVNGSVSYQQNNRNEGEGTIAIFHTCGCCWNFR